jgi:bacillopeptidase F
VSWVSPSEGAQLGSDFSVQAAVTDDHFSGPPADLNPPTATLYLDGVSQGTKSGSYTWNLSGVAVGDHTLHIEASDGNNPPQTPTDRHITVVPAPPVWTRVEDTSTSVSYAGSWSRTRTSCASGRYYHSSTSAGAASTFTFTGIGVRWISMMSPSRGQAEVFVDGIDEGSFDLYSPTTSCRVTEFELTGLSPGQHTIGISVLGTKNASSSGDRVVVDAFEYLN